MGWKSGDWKVTCDLCAKEILASEAKHRWDGLIVCEDDWEARHPMDFIKTPKEDPGVPFSRPEGPLQFVTTNYILSDACSPQGRICAADFGTADCMTVGVTGGTEL